MDLELKQLGQTLAVGAFAMLGFWLIIRIFEQYLFKEKINDSSSPDNKNQRNQLLGDINLDQVKFVLNGIVLAFVFALGIILENISKHVVADREPPSKIIRAIFGWKLLEDKVTRLDIFFARKEDSISIGRNIEEFFTKKRYHNDRVVATGLTDRLRCSSYFNCKFSCPIYNDSSKFMTFDSFRINNEKDDIFKFSNNLYYQSKDRVYQESQAYQELSAISTRMDFLRAFVFLLILLLVIISSIIVFKTTPNLPIGLILMFCLFLFFIILSWYDYHGHLLAFFILVALIISVIDIIKNKKNQSNVRKDVNFFNLTIFYILCYILFLILPTAYEAECSNYNRRVIGYHLSLMKKNCEKCEEKDNCQKAIESTKSPEPQTTITNYYNTQQISKKSNSKNQNSKTATTNNLGNSNLPCVNEERKIDSLQKLVKALRQKNSNKK